MTKVHSKIKVFSSFDQLKEELFPDLTLEEASLKRGPERSHLWIDLANSSVDSLIQKAGNSRK
jgi:hypothetical protein